jgi:hypothetical protein
MNVHWALGTPFSSSAPHFCSAMGAIGAMGDIFSKLEFLFENLGVGRSGAQISGAQFWSIKQ